MNIEAARDDRCFIVPQFLG